MEESSRAKGNEVHRYKMVRSDWVHRTGEGLMKYIIGRDGGIKEGRRGRRVELTCKFDCERLDIESRD